jgi:hypothetical protein
VPFVLIQIVMVGLIIAFPQLVTSGLDKDVQQDSSNITIMAPQDENAGQDAQPNATATGDGQAVPGQQVDDDLAKALNKAMRQDGAGDGDDPAKALEKALKR